VVAAGPLAPPLLDGWVLPDEVPVAGAAAPDAGLGWLPPDE
jgi:hypothetical protein